MNGHDVGMVERRNATRLLLEAMHSVGVGSNRLGKDFDGDEAVQPGVAGAIYLTHSAFANRREDLVRTEFCAHGQWHGESARL